MKKNIYIIKPGENQGNCYLIKNCTSNILIITGSKISPRNIERNLSKVITKRNIDLIILTQFCKYGHSNLDYFKKKYHSKIAMHVVDYTLPESHKTLIERFFNSIISIYYSLFNKQLLKPDLVIDENYSLKEYGVNARVINLSSVNKEAIGILTDEGELFCDKVFTNVKNLSASKAIVDRFRKRLIDIVYSREGNPILLNQ